MSEIMSRGDIVSAVAAQVDLPQNKVDAIIRAWESAIMRQAATGGETRITGFGSFKVTHRAARVSRNPRTGEPTEVAEHNALRFVPGKALKEAAASSFEPSPAKPKKVVAAKAVAAEPIAKEKKEKKPAKSKKKSQ